MTQTPNDTEKLPTEYPFGDAVIIYAKRFATVLLAAVASGLFFLFALITRDPLPTLYFSFVAWILLAVFWKPLRSSLEAVRASVDGLFGFLIEIFLRASSLMRELVLNTIKFNQQAWKTIQTFTEWIASALAQLVVALNANWRSALQPFGSTDSLIWRIPGAIVYFLATILFIYAVLVQGANNIALLFPGFTIPDFLQDLSIYFLVASIGSAAVLGLIISDFVGLTNFAPWIALMGKQRIVFMGLSAINLIATIVLSFPIVLLRYNLSAAFPQSITQDIRMWAASTQSLLIAPMLITTFLISWWGVTGLLVMWLAILRALIPMLQVIRFFVVLLSEVLSFVIEGTTIVLKILLGFAQLSISILVALLGFTARAIVLLFAIMESLLNIVVYPLVLAGQWIAQRNRPI